MAKATSQAAASTKPRFDYFKPGSLQEAMKLFGRHKGKAAFLAGGTDLIVKMRSGKAAPGALIDVKGIEQLRGIRKAKAQVTIGPLTTLAEIAESAVLKKLLPVLPETALQMASPQVRNRGTIGGNVCNAAPSADMAPPLLVLGAKVRITTKQGMKTVRLEDFFTGPGETLVSGRGLLTAIIVPMPKKGAKAGYETLTLREAMDLSIVSAAALVRRERGRVKEARIALGAVAPVPMMAEKAQKILVGTKGTPEDIAKAAAAAVTECAPIGDVRASQSYRRDMVEVVTRRVLEGVLR
jgi:CO/xanthine dehydrogenase FAD-binding subunit